MLHIVPYIALRYEKCRLKMYDMKLIHEKEKNLFLSFFVPFLLHGIYNFFVGVIFGVSLVVIIVAWFFAIRFFLIMKKKQKTKKREYEKKI